MTLNEIQDIAFMIIAYSGSAIDYYHKAISSANQGDFDKSNEEFKTGEIELSKAHVSQTKLLVAEANSVEVPFSIIMVHAQDHLMSAVLYQRIAQNFIELYKGGRNEK